MSVQLVRGDAAHLPLPDGCVDLVVTSPPYWKLRSYQDQNGHYAGQIGSEPTLAQFIDVLVEATAEWVRCLKPSGSIFVNLGDSYDGGKSLNLAPHRYALAAVERLGLICRAEICWSKPNGLPESVTDRVRRSHEFWFHFVVRPRYYAAVDTIREPQNEPARSTGRVENRGSKSVNGGANNGFGLSGETPREYNPLGKLPGSVWSIPSQPLTVPAHLGVDHFAAFPMEWPRRLILGWSPSGICTRCGEGRRPVTDKRYEQAQATNNAYSTQGHATPGRTPVVEFVRKTQTTTVTGECCACTPYTDHPGSGGSSGERSGNALMAAAGWVNTFPNSEAGGNTSLTNRPRVGPWREYHEWTPPPTRPAVVLDPFSGTGTVALMADVLGRHGIGVDLSHDYNRLAAWRTTDPGERARAMQVDKPEPVMDGQLGLFEGV